MRKSIERILVVKKMRDFAKKLKNVADQDNSAFIDRNVPKDLADNLVLLQEYFNTIDLDAVVNLYAYEDMLNASTVSDLKSAETKARSNKMRLEVARSVLQCILDSLYCIRNNDEHTQEVFRDLLLTLATLINKLSNYIEKASGSSPSLIDIAYKKAMKRIKEAEEAEEAEEEEEEDLFEEDDLPDPRMLRKKIPRKPILKKKF